VKPVARAHIVFIAFMLVGWIFAGLAVVSKKRPPEAATFPELEVERPRPLPHTLPIQYAAWVIYYCDETGVQVWLLCRLISWESGWNPECNRSRVRQNQDGSYDLGLAQLNYGCLKQSEKYNDGRPIDPFDPETAVRVAARLLAALHAELGMSWRAATCVYNVGGADGVSGSAQRGTCE